MRDLFFMAMGVTSHALSIFHPLLSVGVLRFFFDWGAGPLFFLLYLFFFFIAFLCLPLSFFENPGSCWKVSPLRIPEHYETF